MDFSLALTFYRLGEILSRSIQLFTITGTFWWSRSYFLLYWWCFLDRSPIFEDMGGTFSFHQSHFSRYGWLSWFWWLFINHGDTFKISGALFYFLPSFLLYWWCFLWSIARFAFSLELLFSKFPAHFLKDHPKRSRWHFYLSLERLLLFRSPFLLLRRALESIKIKI